MSWIVKIAKIAATVDGVPTHSMMSGFYGLDATGSAGIERIEIARGAGASLIAPEAIGGVINLITKEARQDALDLDIAGRETGYRKASAVGTLVADNDSTRTTFIAQSDARNQVDGDHNQLSESPQMDNQLRLAQDLGEKDNLTLRAGHANSEIFGGPTNTSIGAVKKSTLRIQFVHPNIYLKMAMCVIVIPKVVIN